MAVYVAIISRLFILLAYYLMLSYVEKPCGTNVFVMAYNKNERYRLISDCISMLKCNNGGVPLFLFGYIILTPRI